MADVSSSREASVGLRVRGLEVDTAWGAPIVEGVDLEVGGAEILGVVGESGAGKTTMAMALLGYAKEGARIVRGELVVGSLHANLGDPRIAKELRGRLVSYVPQNPGMSLNPCTRIGAAIEEMVVAHREARGARDVVASALASVGLPDGPHFQRRYPHQLSGGQQQRVCIAVALVCDPPVVVLDEPTTGLDVVTQARILNELRQLRREQNVSMIYVTHDLAVVAQIADSIAVMYAGRVVEYGRAREVLRAPRHPYTRGLLASIPDHLRASAVEPMVGVPVGVGEHPTGCAFAPRCPMRVNECEADLPELRRIEGLQYARCIRAEDVPGPSTTMVSLASRSNGVAPPVLAVSHLRAEYNARHETVVAAVDVSFSVGEGRCVALVGESGSGKTTVARTIVGLHPIAAGEIRLNDDRLAPLARGRSREERRRVQLVFQNPADSLNPRESVREVIARAARALRRLDRKSSEVEVDRLLELVRLPRRLAERYPRDLSGGEQQRIGIARALAAQPDVLICDEITSNLDVSVQAAILKLLSDLRDELGKAIVFITHDLGVVATIADELVVLESGKVCEAGTVAQVLQAPSEPYTQRLLAAAPSISRILAVWDAAEVSQ